MTPALPDEGPERQIFLRALRSYSDHCDAPLLTPDCPFAVPISPSERGCGEECMDLLARFAEPQEPVFEIDLGKGLGAYSRRRPRRGPTLTTKPFDAAEIRAIERDLPLVEQSPTSLLLALQEKLSEPPGANRDTRADRVKEIGVLISLLDHQGFDAERYARHVGIYALLGGLLLRLLLPRYLSDVAASSDEFSEDDLPTLDLSVAAHWLPFFEGAGDNDLLSAVASTMPRIHAALEGSTLERVVAWEPPTDPVSHHAVPRDDAFSRWVRDRFTETYLHDWATSSLEHEWQYLHGNRVAPCEPRHMLTRRIACNDVSYEIARRQVENLDDVFGGIKAADTYVSKAVEMLEAGRRSAAAAIFEAMRAVNPRDEKAHNNYGFCSAPDLPEAALEALDTAARLGMRHDPMNVGNRMYALGKLGRPASALKAADDLWEHLGSGAPASAAIMWNYTDFDGDPELERVEDVYRYVLDLAAALAEAGGDTDTAETWRQRAASRG